MVFLQNHMLYLAHRQRSLKSVFFLTVNKVENSNLETRGRAEIINMQFFFVEVRRLMLTGLQSKYFPFLAFFIIS